MDFTNYILQLLYKMEEVENNLDDREEYLLRNGAETKNEEKNLKTVKDKVFKLRQELTKYVIEDLGIDK